jgi:hypothetical protein
MVGRQRSAQRRSRSLARAIAASPSGCGTNRTYGSPAGAQRVTQLKEDQELTQPPFLMTAVCAAAKSAPQNKTESASAVVIGAADRADRFARAQWTVNTARSIARLRSIADRSRCFLTTLRARSAFLEHAASAGCNGATAMPAGLICFGTGRAKSEPPIQWARHKRVATVRRNRRKAGVIDGAMRPAWKYRHWP